MSEQLNINTSLQGGKYIIKRVLGQGGFGNTYVGYNTYFDEIVAIKEFFVRGVTERDETTCAVTVSNDKNVPQFEEQREKFKKEARRIRKLKNEHIVKVHDLFEENGTAYYVMDYIDGENLAERMKRLGKPLSETEIRSILQQILSALKEVHQNEIWHLDIKPGNIMFEKDGIAYLIDFGASKQIRASGGMTTSTALCYTPGYAPNEQIGQMYDRFGPWTDIYAVGATIYTLLTNRKPPMAIDIEEEEENAFVFPTDVSEEMRKMILWMMQPKRKARPQSVDEIIDFLSKKKQFVRKEEPANAPSVDEETVFISQSPKTVQAQNFGSSVVSPSSANHKTDISNRHLSPVIQELVKNMVKIEGGTFTMGATIEQNGEAFSNEKPAHNVTLSSFYIGRFEVTQEEWETVMGSNPSKFRESKRPVENVSWNDCQEFIRKLNAMTGKQFRLPTEAEWEFAARGGNNSKGYKYAGGNSIGLVAWYEGNSGRSTHTVGQMAPNELGLFDMTGNVWEWCSDWKGSYNSSPQTNPKGASISIHARRGGSWNTDAKCCRVSYRSNNYPDDSGSFLGFRLAL